jgi:hypothetical protein
VRGPGVVPRSPGSNVVSNVIRLSLGRPVPVGPCHTVLVTSVRPSTIASGSGSRGGLGSGRGGSRGRRSWGGPGSIRRRCSCLRWRGSGLGWSSSSLAVFSLGGRRRNSGRWGGSSRLGSGGGRSGGSRSSDSADGTVSTSSNETSASLLGDLGFEPVSSGKVLVMISSLGTVRQGVLVVSESFAPGMEGVMVRGRCSIESRARGAKVCCVGTGRANAMRRETTYRGGLDTGQGHTHKGEGGQDVY